MTLIELLAGKGATPEAVEASIRSLVQDEVATALASVKADLQQGEQKALDAAKADLQAGIAQLGIIGAALLDKAATLASEGKLHVVGTIGTLAIDLMLETQAKS